MLDMNLSQPDVCLGNACRFVKKLSGWGLNVHILVGSSKSHLCVWELITNVIVAVCDWLPQSMEWEWMEDLCPCKKRYWKSLFLSHCFLSLSSSLSLCCFFLSLYTQTQTHTHWKCHTCIHTSEPGSLQAGMGAPTLSPDKTLILDFLLSKPPKSSWISSQGAVKTSSRTGRGGAYNQPIILSAAQPVPGVRVREPRLGVHFLIKVSFLERLLLPAVTRCSYKKKKQKQSKEQFYWVLKLHRSYCPYKKFAQPLKGLASKPADMSSNPGTPMVEGGREATFISYLWPPHVWCHACQHMYTHEKKIFFERSFCGKCSYHKLRFSFF